MSRSTRADSGGAPSLDALLEPYTEVEHPEAPGTAPGLKRKIHYNVTPRATAVRGWRATFMSF
jgi:hypothetical protein